MTDAGLFVWLNSLPPHWMGMLLLFVTHLGSIPVMPAWLALLAYIEGEDRVRALRWYGEVLAVALACAWGLKYLVARARPWTVLREAHTFGARLTDYSFPSGHTTASFALATAVALRWPRSRWVVLGLAGLVGVSRVAVGMHYPGDVIAGMAIGAGSAFALRLLRPWSPVRAKASA